MSPGTKSRQRLLDPRLVFSAGVIAGIALSAGAFVWGAAPYKRSLRCEADGVKTSAICDVVEHGNIWTFQSRWLNIRSQYPGFETAFGPDCVTRYDAFIAELEAYRRDVERRGAAARLFEEFECQGQDCERRKVSHEAMLAAWKAEMATDAALPEPKSRFNCVAFTASPRAAPMDADDGHGVKVEDKSG